jgi:hypothetical protein
MENRFLTIAQKVDSCAILAIAGQWACIAAALFYWLGLIESTPYSLVADLFPSDFPKLVVWIIGGASWLMTAVLWVEIIRFRVAVLEAGSNPNCRS